MANKKEIQSRMKSIQDTMKITNAMYMISSSKLKKARKRLEATEPYFRALLSNMSRILRHIPEMENEYFDQRPDKKPADRQTGFLVVTADKGMAGAYNHNILKFAQAEMEKYPNPRLFVLGELGRQYFERKQIPVENEFQYTVQNPTLGRARNIGEILLEQYQEQRLDEIILIYTRMESSMKEEVEMISLLPLKKAELNQRIPLDIHMERLAMVPDGNTVMNHIVPDFLVGIIYGALVESFSSEQNARMMAMEAATKSAGEMLKDLSVIFNRARQADITQEITEVISGAKSQKKKRVS